MMILPSLWLFIALPLVQCANFDVVVGGPGVLRYDPEFVNAQIGDSVSFIFKQKNHTVTQSSFQTPCQPAADGFDTGFIPVADSVKDGFPVAQLNVTTASPVWVYCRQANHCQQGMVFAINPGSDFAAFKSAAMGRPVSSSALPPPAASSVLPPPNATASGSIAAATVTATVTVTQLPSTVVSSQASSATAMSVDHRVIVGGPGQFTFQPSDIKANVGDTITFEFRQKNHTVTASSFSEPCRPLSSTSTTGEVGFDSGFMPVADTATSFPTFTVQVNDTKPIWAYCRQPGHCGQGMVFAANAVDNGPNTFDAFQALAKQLNGTTSSSTGPANNGAMARGAGTTIWAILIIASAMGLML